MKQLGTGIQMYANDSQQLLPWPNWGVAASPPCPPGWLFAGTLPPQFSQAVYNLNPANAALAIKNAISGGVLYQYVANVNSFHCPLDQPGDPTTSWSTRAQQLSTYTMDPSAAFASPPDGGSTSGGNSTYKTMKITQVWSPECIILWEQPIAPGTGDWNDGSSFPNSQGLGNAHLNGGLVLQLDASAYFMKTNVWNTYSAQPPTGQNNILWWGTY
jgi:hypothetical protein